MNAISHRRRGGQFLSIVATLIVIAVVLNLIQRKDSAIVRVAEKLQPGMTDDEVRQVLNPIRHAQLPTQPGEYAYAFYGFNEFVTVVMAQDGHDAKVSKILHEPDVGPAWDRMRRNWERRFW